MLDKKRLSTVCRKGYSECHSGRLPRRSREMTRITADQARDKAKAKDPSAAVAEILDAVANAAEEGKYEIQVRQHGFGSGSYYSTEEKWPEFGKAVIKELKGLGYQCRVRCYEGQFVDMWLEVSWKGDQP